MTNIKEYIVEKLNYGRFHRIQHNMNCYPFVSIPDHRRMIRGIVYRDKNNLSIRLENVKLPVTVILIEDREEDVID